MIDQAIEANGGSPQKTLESIGGNAMVFKSFGGSIVHHGVSPKSNKASEGGDALGETKEDIHFQTNEHLGRYTYGVNSSENPDDAEEIGRGGTGRVTRSTDSHLGREIAVKELLGDGQGSVPVASDIIGSHNAGMIARFLREARVTAQLQHPCIMPVYEMGVREDGRLYYTMQLVKGRTLADALAGCQSLEDRLQYLPHFVDMCQAIAFAHNKGVVHRDTVSENVMIGNLEKTIVLDWGLAKVKGKQDIQGQELAAEIREFQDANIGKTLDGKALVHRSS